MKPSKDIVISRSTLLISLTLLSCRMISENDDSRTERLRIDELQRRLVDPDPEETFPASYNNRKDHEPVLVDEVVLHQRVHKIAAAEDQDVLTGLLLQPGHFLRDVPFDQPRIVP